VGVGEAGGSTGINSSGAGGRGGLCQWHQQVPGVRPHPARQPAAVRARRPAAAATWWWNGEREAAPRTPNPPSSPLGPTPAQRLNSLVPLLQQVLPLGVQAPEVLRRPVELDLGGLRMVAVWGARRHRQSPPRPGLAAGARGASGPARACEQPRAGALQPSTRHPPPFDHFLNSTGRRGIFSPPP
jgi:hypothetical protein